MGQERKSSTETASRHPSRRRRHRILAVAPQPFYENRGTPIALRKVLESLSRLGHRVDLVTFPVGERVDLPGLHIFRVGRRLPIRRVPIGFSLRKAFLDLFLVPAILRRVRTENYRYIYALEEAAFVALLLRRWHRLPVIYDMQSSLPEQLESHRFFGRKGPQTLLKAVERWTIRNAARVMCSAGLREHVLSVEPSAVVGEWFFPVDPPEVAEGDPDRLREELFIGPGCGVVLYTGNFKAYQGVDRLLAAAAIVADEEPGAVFVLVGDEVPSLLPCPEIVRRLRERGVLRLVTRLPQPAIHRFLAMADVVVSPRDGTGNVGLKVFEYMAAGKAIVATDTAAHRKVLAEDRALLVDPSPRAMADAIVRLLRDREAGKRLGEAARAYSGRHLSRAAFDDSVADFHGKATP